MKSLKNVLKRVLVQKTDEEIEEVFIPEVNFLKFNFYSLLPFW